MRKDVKVFISWSGDLSLKIAEVIREWLPSALQAVKPFFTPSDIEKGARWASEIASELKSSDIGLFVITKENLEKPWIMFEAGAISRQMDVSEICVLMFGIDSADLKGPLIQFQATKFERLEFKKLIRNINSSLGESALTQTVLDDVFDMYWPILEEKIKKIMDDYKIPAKTGSARDQREILEEILNITRSIQKNSGNVNPPSTSIPRPTSTVPIYSGSTYEIFVKCLQTIIYGPSLENEQLDEIEPAMIELRRLIQERRLLPKLKNDMLEPIDSMIRTLASERDRNNQLTEE